MQPYTQLENGTYMTRYESIEETFEDCNRGWWDYFNHNGFNQHWVGYDKHLATFDEATAAYRSVWEHGLDTMRRFVRELQNIELPEVRSRVRRIRFDENNGDELDFDRLRSGQDYWRESRRQESVGPQEVTIICDVGTSCDVSAEDMCWRGAATVALVSLLEERGYRCEVWMTNGGFDMDETKKFFHVVRLKHMGDPLDESSLVNATSVWMYRSTFFTLSHSRVNSLNGTPSTGVKMPCSPNDTELDFVSTDENRIFIADVYEFDDAAKLVQRELQNLVERHH